MIRARLERSAKANVLSPLSITCQGKFAVSHISSEFALVLQGPHFAARNEGITQWTLSLIEDGNRIGSFVRIHIGGLFNPQTQSGNFGSVVEALL
jgi:hypothetical protein